MIEEHCHEYMTPGRQRLALEYLAEGEALTYDDIRRRAKKEHGVGYGHGNTLIDFLKKRAIADDDELPSYNRRYTLAEQDMLAAEWEGGPGRGE
jgi:hypothetical protein